ncbi:MAG: hypothetical protein JW987_03430, partial [Anaerolineaceae bacterium]|nr:hypothetical protein [Anaerolineaceae bacterium]
LLAQWNLAVFMSGPFRSSLGHLTSFACTLLFSPKFVKISKFEVREGVPHARASQIPVSSLSD